MHFSVLVNEVPVCGTVNYENMSQNLHTLRM
jgi:hypothetical protein